MTPTAPRCRVALVTPPGRGAIASVMLQGDDSDRIWISRFQSNSGRSPSQIAEERIAFGRWQFHSDSAEEVVLSRRRFGIVEIHCHGGVAASRRILQSAVELGATEVDWRELVQFVEGDKIAAEARIALAGALTRPAAVLLIHQWQGALSREVNSLCDLVKSHNENAVREGLERLLDRSSLGLHLTKPWDVVVAGAPNVGKSTLINALLGYQRSIVHGEPGTTRDVISATTAIQGWPIELSDTAGLRKSEDSIEQAGVIRAHQRIDAADLILWVVSAVAPDAPSQTTSQPHAPRMLTVINKCDLETAPHSLDGIRVSALRGDGLGTLIDRIASALVRSAPHPTDGVPFTLRQVQQLRDAQAAFLRHDWTATEWFLRHLLEGDADG